MLAATRLRAGLILLGGIAASGYVYLFDPATTAAYPSCPVRGLTGLQCTGCGTLRALHRLLHGEIGGALELNPLAVAMTPLLAWYLGAAAYRLVGDRALPGLRPSPAFTRVLLGVLAVFTVARNVWPGVWGVPA